MKKLCFFRYFTNSEFSSKIDQFYNVCKLDFSVYEMSQERNLEFKLLNEIVSKSLNSQLDTLKPYTIVKCAIKCIVKYSIFMKIKSKLNLSEKKSLNKYDKSIQNFRKLIIFFKSDYQKDIVNIVISIMHEEKLWEFRRLCYAMCIELYDCGYNQSLICNEICNILNFKDELLENEDHKSVTNVLHKLLGTINWAQTPETELFIHRLMNIYYKSLQNETDEDYDPFFASLRGSLELCVIHIIQHISKDHILIIIEQLSSWSVGEDVNQLVILNYGSALEFAANNHNDPMLSNTFTPNVFPLLMQMISSDLPFASLLGNRVFQSLLDRNNNKTFFNTPKIFFPDVKINFKVQNKSPQDITFFINNRDIIHKSLIKSIINHKSKRSNLETAYCTICLLILEIPCGFSAAAVCCLMMNLQKIVRQHSDFTNQKIDYHIHAIIISVLSFVSWIYQATDFSEYVNKIVTERAHWAPHLNPPLKTVYDFAAHHIMYDKSELYLKDWEVRYGLWRRFRLDGSTNDAKEIQEIKSFFRHWFSF